MTKKMVNGALVDLTPAEEAEREAAAIAHAASLSVPPPATPPSMEEIFTAIKEKFEAKPGADQKLSDVAAKFESAKVAKALKP